MGCVGGGGGGGGGGVCVGVDKNFYKEMAHITTEAGRSRIFRVG